MSRPRQSIYEHFIVCFVPILLLSLAAAMGGEPSAVLKAGVYGSTLLFVMCAWKLRASASFWLCLILMAYMFVQALNPSWKYAYNADAFWINALMSEERIPSGVWAPFEISNAYRVMCVVFIALCCGGVIWTRVRTRRGLRLFGNLMLGGSTVLAGVAWFQAFRDVPSLWGEFEVSSHFYGSFPYRNHAGAFFYLNMGLAMSMSLLAWQKTLRAGRFGGIQFLYLFVALLLGVTSVYSESRGAVLAVSVLAGVYLLLIVGMLLRKANTLGRVFVVGLMGCLLAGLGYCALEDEYFDWMQKRFERLEQDISREGVRAQLREASLEMFREHRLYGVGAGAWRYRFPQYQQKYPALRYAWGTRPARFNHAHNDYLQWLSELGVVGVSIAGLIVLMWVWRFTAHVRLSSFWAWILVSALGVMAFHAWYDFLFQSPALLVLYVSLAVWCVRMLKLERLRRG